MTLQASHDMDTLPFVGNRQPEEPISVSKDTLIIHRHSQNTYLICVPMTPESKTDYEWIGNIDFFREAAYPYRIWVNPSKVCKGALLMRINSHYKHRPSSFTPFITMRIGTAKTLHGAFHLTIKQCEKIQRYSLKIQQLQNVSKNMDDTMIQRSIYRWLRGISIDTDTDTEEDKHSPVKFSKEYQMLCNYLTGKTSDEQDSLPEYYFRNPVPTIIAMENQS